MPACLQGTGMRLSTCHLYVCACACPAAVGFTYELCAGIIDKPGLDLQQITREEVGCGVVPGLCLCWAATLSCSAVLQCYALLHQAGSRAYSRCHTNR